MYFKNFGYTGNVVRNLIQYFFNFLKNMNELKPTKIKLIIAIVIYLSSFMLGLFGFACAMGGSNNIVCYLIIGLFRIFGFGFIIGDNIHKFTIIFSESEYWGFLFQILWAYLFSVIIIISYKKLKKF